MNLSIPVYGKKIVSGSSLNWIETRLIASVLDRDAINRVCTILVDGGNLKRGKGERIITNAQCSLPNAQVSLLVYYLLYFLTERFV
jgi:hypothetical protein